MEKTMRKHKDEIELLEIAMELASAPLTLITNDGEVKRKPTKKQKELIYKIVYGALLGLNWGESTRTSRTSEQAILDTAEFTYNVMMESTFKNGETVNGYLSLYSPLKKVLREWERV